MNFPDDSTSSETYAGLTINPISIDVMSATTGIIILLLIKSKKSRIDFPRIVKLESTPKPSDDGIAIRNENIITNRQAGVLLILNFSMIIETMVSISEIADVSAAKRTSRKNTSPKI